VILHDKNEKYMKRMISIAKKISHAQKKCKSSNKIKEYIGM